MKPYKQLKIGKVIIRLFYKKENHNKLYKWHFDDENRIVFFFPFGNWKFQFDNQLPFDIKFGTKLYIPQKTYHRLINNSKFLLTIILE